MGQQIFSAKTMRKVIRLLNPLILTKSFPVIDYKEALNIQLEYHRLCVEGVYNAVFLALEHPPTITLGKHASQKDLLFSESFLSSKGIQVYRSDRGGQVTCHMSGQLVIYSIVSLAYFSLGVRDYVSVLQDSLLDLLRDYGVKGELSQNNPGVWVLGKKIASIGVRVKEHVTYHGIALNVTNTLEIFQMVVPCGMRGCEMVRLKDLTESSLERVLLEKRFIDHLSGHLLSLCQKKVG